MIEPEPAVSETAATSAGEGPNDTDPLLSMEGVVLSFGEKTILTASTCACCRANASSSWARAAAARARSCA